MEKILRFMELLIEEGIALESLAGSSPDQRESQGFTRRYKRWSKNIVEILKYASMESHLHDAEEVVKSNLIGWEGEKAYRLAGIIESAYDLAKNGFMGRIKFLLHADMFGSLLEQAKILQEAGHLIPAGVVGRIIIEDWLRDQAEKAGIELTEKAKASATNDALKKASIFNVPKWRQVQTFLDIGNLAAHGKASEFSESDISKLLEFIEVNCT